MVNQMNKVEKNAVELVESILKLSEELEFNDLKALGTVSNKLLMFSFLYTDPMKIPVDLIMLDEYINIFTTHKEEYPTEDPLKDEWIAKFRKELLELI